MAAAPDFAPDEDTDTRGAQTMNTYYLPLPARLLILALAAFLWILLTPLLAHGAPLG